MTSVRITFDGRSHDVTVQDDADGRTVTVAGRSHRVQGVRRADDGSLVVTLDGAEYRVRRTDLHHAIIDETEHHFRLDAVQAGVAAGAIGAEGAQIRPPMPGKIVRVAVAEGDVVEAGQVLLVLEAMKMQNEVTSPAAGRVRRIHVEAGHVVDGKDLLLELGPVEEPADATPKIAA